jgi:hypothetical protein
MENEADRERSNVHYVKRPKRLLSRPRLVMGLLLIVAIPIFIGLANRAVRKKRRDNQAGVQSIGGRPWLLHISWRYHLMLLTAASLLVNPLNV